MIEFSTTTSVKNRKSFQGINIYNVPQGQTVRFINHSKGNPVQASINEDAPITPHPYEIPSESLYQDPGVKKEKIYEWLEKKKYRKLKSSDIK